MLKDFSRKVNSGGTTVEKNRATNAFQWENLAIHL
jgi:hypothetical protein